MKNNTLKMLLISSSLFSISSSNFAHSTNLSQSFQLKNLFRNINVGTKNYSGNIKQSFNLKNMSGLGKLTPRYSIKTNARAASSAFNFSNIFASSKISYIGAHTIPVTNTRSTSSTARFANMFAAPHVKRAVTLTLPVKNTKSTVSPAARFTTMFATSQANHAVAHTSPITNTKSAASPAASFANIFASLSHSTQAVKKVEVNHVAAARQAAAQQAEGTRLANEQAARQTAARQAAAQQAERTRLANEQAARQTAAQRAAAQQAERTRLANEQAARQTAAQQAAAQQAERTRLANEQAARQTAARQAAAQQAERTRLANEQAAQQAAAQQAARQNNAWAAMTKQQKILTVVDKVFLDPAAGANYGVPANLHEQALIKNIFQELMNDNTINIALINIPNAQPQNFRVLFPFITPHVVKAVQIQKYESAPYNMTRQEAKECVTFSNKYNQTIKEFPLDLTKKVVFYTALKANFGAMPWAEVIDILTPILKNSLPLDYDEWPNFETNPGANFDNFIQNIVTPAINAVRGQANIEEAAENYTKNLLITREQYLKANIAQKIIDYQQLNDDYINRELTNHGAQIPLINVFNTSFRDLNNEITFKLMDLDDDTRGNAALRTRINFTHFCADPFLSLLRAPDAKLGPLTQGYGVHINEVNNFKARVLNLIPAQDRILDNEFEASFSGWGLGGQTEMNKSTVIRLKRLYDCIKESQGDVAAARVIYAFGTENSQRCIDGKRDRITELERQYVYITGNQAANRDLNTIIGLNLSKLFMDDRMDKLRQTIDTLYDAGEPRTYAWFRSHRALYLGFGISGKYEDMAFGGHHREGINPTEFIEKYFKGGNITGTNSFRNHNIEAFTVDKMATLVLNDIKKEMGGSFDDNTLDYMINSNLALRRAYTEFQDNEGDATFENQYFKDANLNQRQALKNEAIVEILKNYSYVYKRNDVNNMWE